MVLDTEADKVWNVMALNVVEAVDTDDMDNCICLMGVPQDIS